jgi:translocation and assembly module TamB
LRRFLNKRTLLIAAALLLLAAVSALVGVYLYVNSPAFNERVRNFIVERMRTYTGAQVSLERVRWNLTEQRLVLENLTLRGTESETEPPLAHIESITAGVNLRSLMQRRIDLFELTIVNPEFHLHVDSKGQTNVPGPAKRQAMPETQVTLSIDNLKVTGGRGIINDKQTDLDFAIAKLMSDLRYRSDTQVLSVRASYAGTLGRPGQSPIPYELSSDFDYTRGSIIAQKIQLASEKSSVALQGRIDKVLTPDVNGKLAYTGNLQTTLLKSFLPQDTFTGSLTARGELDFSVGNFSTMGDAESKGVGVDEWNTGALKTNYAYSYPAGRLNLTHVTAKLLDGDVAGSIVVDSLLEKPRVTLNIDFGDINAAQLTRLYPWDPRYIIYSRATGKLQGFFTGRLAAFEFQGDARLSSYSAPRVQGVTPLPLDGAASFSLKPDQFQIKSSDIRYFDTGIQAYGQLQKGQVDLAVNLASSNLANLAFIYPDANGKGTFKGTVRGPLEKPLLDGVVSLDNHKYREWTIQHAEGSAVVNMQTELAELKDVSVNIGQSTATVNGTARLDGSAVNVRIKSDHIRAEDFQSITKEKVSGLLAGNITVTSLQPIKAEGHVKGSGLMARGQTFDTIEGDVTYNDPSVEIRNLTVSERAGRLTGGNVQYNRSTGAIRASADVTSVNLDQVREFGIPEALKGNLQRAHINVSGTQDRPIIDGNATIENLSVRGETFPQARLKFDTMWPYLTVTVSETGNVSLSARVDMSSSDYPFEGSAKFENYSLERLANFKQGTLTASGDANLKGRLTGEARLSGSGVIRALRAEVRGYPFTSTKPFPFSFDVNKITLAEEASLNGAYGSRIGLKGSIGLMDTPVLDLTVGGNLDLSEIAAVNQSLSVTGKVNLDARVGGTAANPNISGIANISNASLGKEGIYTTLTMLNGDVRFNENRVTFDNLEGRVGGGTVRIRGTGLIQNSQLESLNVRLDADQVRLRYPAGLRSSVTGTLVLRGTSSKPLLDGNLRLDSMAYRGDFEPFLAIFRPGGLDSGGTALDNLQLSVHVEGNRNITVQNELTNISSARVALDVKGTLGSPSLTGHVEANEGALFFQGKRYEVTRGNIDFADPLKIDPIVDIQAETDIRDYHIILAVSGRGDLIHVDLRSDPALSNLEIISLIAGGKTREEIDEQNREREARGGSTTTGVNPPTSEQLFQGASASILSNLLRTSLGSRFGLMGLDWIQIDPHFETAIANPTLRVTLSQQVSKDLSVTYSQDLASNQQRLVMIEYFISKNLSIVASREESNETSALGLDIKLRKRF